LANITSFGIEHTVSPCLTKIQTRPTGLYQLIGLTNNRVQKACQEKNHDKIKKFLDKTKRERYETNQSVFK